MAEDQQQRTFRAHRAGGTRFAVYAAAKKAFDSAVDAYQAAKPDEPTVLPRCVTVDQATGRRCQLADGHPALPVERWEGLEITRGGHIWEDPPGGSDE